MRISKLGTLLVLALLAFSGSGLSWAQPGMEAKPKPTETLAPHLTWRQMMDKLQLTSEQRQAVLKNRHTYRRAMAEIDGKIKVKQVELENEFERSDPDQTKLDLIVQEIGVLYGQRLSERVKAKLELEKKILNQQQVDLLKTLEGPQSEEEP
jgi:Spy/CpxP family protein refolding chaperone